MKIVFLFASIAVASGVLLTNIYTSIIDAKSWGADIPHSIETARQYFKSVNPGNFFRIFSPLNQGLGLLVLILFWKSSPGIRMNLGIAFVFYLLGEALTFGFFYPRNDIMFRTAQLTDVDLLRRTWSQWNSVNWIRSLVLLIGLVFSFISLHKIYTLK
ncbi:MAG: hypothetical protein ABUT20_26650 [Bacteroidota bacterium]